MTGLPTPQSDHSVGANGRDDVREPHFAVLADDLTGAADAAVALAGPARDAEIHLALPQDPQSGAAVMAIDLDTRRMPVDAARSVTARCASSLVSSHRHLFKKIDSTLRGHIGAELAALYRQAWPACDRGSHGQTHLCIVAPAHPLMGRFMRSGRLTIQDATTGANLSSRATGGTTLSDQLQASGFTCTPLHVDDIRRCSPAQLTRLIEHSAKHDMAALVCDGESMEDLHRIVRAALASNTRSIWVGSGGLAQALSASHAPSHTDPAVSPHLFVKPKEGSQLFVVGSYSEVARRQVEALRASSNVGLLALSAEELLDSGLAAQRNTLDTWLTEGRDVVVTVRPDGPIRPELSLHLATGLARLIAPTVGRLGALVCCGGDTSRALFDALGLVRIRARQAHETGVTHIHADTWPTLPIVLKAGAFGDAHTLARLRHRLAASTIDATTP
ncbi:MAG TPA: four-carbon acid sugar kinase family protein [Burkholderiaceae bacterium]|nr:four-carbon acid sugar kinase family protein [Burkholderiaceae bacterium]